MMFGGWYIVGFRDGRALALVAGPFADFATAHGRREAAIRAARQAFATRPSDLFGEAFMMLPTKIPGVCNEALWVDPVYEEGKEQ